MGIGMSLCPLLLQHCSTCVKLGHWAIGPLGLHQGAVCSAERKGEGCDQNEGFWAQAHHTPAERGACV